MYTNLPNPRRFDDAVRSPHRVVTKATFTNLITGAALKLKVRDGDVTEDANAGARRTLTVTVPNEQATWDAFDTVGGEIAVTQAMRYVDGGLDTVPMGTFIVDADDIGYGPGDTISISSAPDRWGKVQKAKMPPNARASVASNTVPQEIKRLVEGAWSSAAYPFPGWSQLDTSVTAKVGPLLYDDGDREAAALDLCRANGLEVYFDRTGKAVLRLVPQLTSSSKPVGLVNAGDRGVMVSARRTRDRSKIRNVIIVSTSAPDVVFNPVEVKNTSAGDPLSVNGPLGYQSEDYSSPLLRNSAQAQAAGKARLAKTLGVAKQLSLEAVGNFCLDAGDVITVALPRIDRTTYRQNELHIIDSVSHPLSPSGTQSITTRSTRPDTDGT